VSAGNPFQSAERDGNARYQSSNMIVNVLSATVMQMIDTTIADIRRSSFD
jgi:hypothetical protein